jgi:uncharacterized cupredoxin-like copper-binding protein
MKHLFAHGLVVLTAFAGTVHAHGDAGHSVPSPVAATQEQTDWGVAGQPQAARRTVHVRMRDSMRFSPDRIDVKQGETVRFVIHNEGQVLHEFVIGTRKENEAHAALMLKFPEMEHDAPHMAHVPPAGQGEIVWTFNRAGTFEFACLIAGHYQAGMVGTLVVVTK